jgi:hypothetical protein
MNLFTAPAFPPTAVRRSRPRPGWDHNGLVAQIGAGLGDDPGPGGWSGGFANQAHWDPARSREWRCWAQTGPTWSAHCGAAVAADDTLGLCHRHRRSLLEEDVAGSRFEGAGPGRFDGTDERADERPDERVAALAGAGT